MRHFESQFGNRIVSGIAYIAGSGILLISIFFEYSYLFIVFSLLPLFLAGGLLGYFRFTPIHKFWISIGIIMTLCFVSVILNLGKAQILETTRTEIIEAELPKYPRANAVLYQYFRGDGFDNEPTIVAHFSTNGNMDEVIRFYSAELSARGWTMNSKNGWMKNTFGIYISPLNENEYSVVMHFWGGWKNDFFFKHRRSDSARL